MRYVLIGLALLFIGFIGYAYTKNPDGCWKIIHDCGDLLASISPVSVEIKTNATAAPAPDTNTPPANPAPPPAVVATPPPPPSTTPVIIAPNATPSTPVFDPNATSGIPAILTGKLIDPAGAPYATRLSTIKYYAIYYSAQWCPPCHIFTPQLVRWYNTYKPAHSNFELIFVSEDHNADAQAAYIKEMDMPWPSVRFTDLKHDGNGTFKGSGIEQYAGNGIPDLVLVDSDGKVLLDTYQNGSYTDPVQVMNAIPAKVGN